MKLSCEQGREYISRALDMELNRKEMRELFVHLGECETCLEAMAQMSRLDQSLYALREAEQIDPPSGEKVINALREIGKPPAPVEPASECAGRHEEIEEHIRMFLSELKKNGELLNELRHADREGLIRLTRRMGVFVPLPRLKEVLLQMRQAGGEGELSDEDLERVAGGIGGIGEELLPLGDELLMIIGRLE